jgi:pSer/pThr/pTyr-binding forkhead associated (FHA) protein
MSQRLILEVIDGPFRGETRSISAGRTLMVGRLPECDLSIPQDLTVSRQHFRVEFDPPECRLVHLSQTGETLVNDVSVTSANLFNGDQIAFGTGNSLRVRFEELPVAASAVIANRTAHKSSATTTKRNRITTSPTSSGLNVYTSVEPQLDFQRLLELLGQSQKLYAVIDFRRIGQPLPENLTKSQLLFPWLSLGAQATFSPILLSQAASPDLGEILNAGWGRDGIVCCGSSSSEEDLLAHWRKAVGVIGEVPILSGLSWLFFEAPDAPGNWSFYANEQVSSVLTSAGLSLVDPAETLDSTNQKKTK